MKNNLLGICAVVCIALAFSPKTAHAQLVVFADRTVFNADYPHANVENWDEYADNTFIPNGSTLNGITYTTNSPFEIKVTNDIWGKSPTHSLGTYALNSFEPPDDTITFTFAKPLDAFSIDIGAITGTKNDVFKAILSNGALVNSYYDPLPGSTEGDFIGFSDSNTFTSVTIEDPNFLPYNLESLEYQYAPSVVPEPSSIFLMILGLMGIALFIIRRKNALNKV